MSGGDAEVHSVLSTGTTSARLFVQSGGETGRSSHSHVFDIADILRLS